ncbi:hypothetical protein [Bradyrhizobium sp. MOS003]|uniref:hypothetical protein n=1 Tax=Bradyrhizobium sp. MOS003 TaxID=2133946 RepID=UPI001FDEA5FA|nr:hypothetical protein [Bradyrhizobium sp. MOS003]
MSFQLSILKILDGQTEGRASLEVIKQHLAILYTSGQEWTGRMRRLAERAPGLDIFGQKLVVREPDVWNITEEGRSFLAILEGRGVATEDIAQAEPSPAGLMIGARARPGP